MITFPYRNDAEFGLARAMQFANHYGIPFNNADNEEQAKFNFNRFVGKIKSLFDYKIDVEQVCDNDSAVMDDLLASFVFCTLSASSPSISSCSCLALSSNRGFAAEPRRN